MLPSLPPLFSDAAVYIPQPLKLFLDFVFTSISDAVNVASAAASTCIHHHWARDFSTMTRTHIQGNACCHLLCASRQNFYLQLQPPSPAQILSIGCLRKALHPSLSIIAIAICDSELVQLTRFICQICSSSSMKIATFDA
jgi:hypothetical protein